MMKIIAKLTLFTMFLLFLLGISSCFYVTEASLHDDFVFGSQAYSPQPNTVDEFIPVFADQLRRYNFVAADLWPDNAITKLNFVIDDVDTGRMWLIDPQGTVSPLTEKEAAKIINVKRQKIPGVWDFYGDFFENDKHGNIFYVSYEGKDLSSGGIYYSVSEAALNDIELWGKWPHVSTYDILRLGVHESFHLFEQQKWQDRPLGEIANLETKDQQLNNTEARIKRDLLLRQILAAVYYRGEKKAVLAALATYKDYKTRFPDDYNNSIYWERIEGTANYVEYVSSIYIYYPSQIKSKEDVDSALSQLANQDAFRLTCGVVDEAHEIGAFTGILLDQLGIDWKTQLINDPMLTPLEILSLNYKGKFLPKAKQPTQTEIDGAVSKIKQKKADIKAILEGSILDYETMMEFAPEDERAWMEVYIVYLKNRIRVLSKGLNDSNC